MKPKVDFVEVVRDPHLKAKEKEATRMMRRFYPDCGPITLYRTAKGRIGMQLKLAVTTGDRKRFDQAYRAVMKVLGEKRGRPAGEKTVQAKLHLPVPIFKALKETAEATHSTMSRVVADSLRAQLRSLARRGPVAEHGHVDRTSRSTVSPSPPTDTARSSSHLSPRTAIR